jgi:predicted nucleic acid-binding protein
LIVVDAGALSDALLDDGSVGISARRALTTDPHWGAPTHLLVEVVSVVRARTLAGKLGPARAHDAIDALATLVVDYVETIELVDRMWQLRDNLTAHEAAYVAAAEVLGCPLVTGNGRLAKATDVRCEIRLVPAA